MPSSINAAMQRSRSYWFRDGIPEIVIGIYFALVGVLFVVEILLGDAGGSFSAIGLPVVIVGGMFGSRWLVARLKDRITHPRTGYVAYPTAPAATRRRAIAIGALVAVGVAAFVGFASASETTSDMIAGIGNGTVFAVLYIALGLRSGAARMFVLAAIAMASVAILLAIGGGSTAASGAMFLAVGLTQSALGVGVLLRYLAQTSPPEPDGDAGDPGDDAAGDDTTAADVREGGSASDGAGAHARRQGA